MSHTPHDDLRQLIANAIIYSNRMWRAGIRMQEQIDAGHAEMAVDHADCADSCAGSIQALCALGHLILAVDAALREREQEEATK